MPLKQHLPILIDCGNVVVDYICCQDHVAALNLQKKCFIAHIIEKVDHSSVFPLGFFPAVVAGPFPQGRDPRVIFP